ncbi:CYFA0S18e00518g1_1 [Cyberlindnera fabianii]|uniref:CYFA0S18e00518g1_1 n=1 Tax=Cyberlindnera fabianii TaxID=36022 RepID=A0A061B691_CYBFA|nr:CYFA0S18e00518g1_1 [Cyberlindnera fabianii]
MSSERPLNPRQRIVKLRSYNKTPLKRSPGATPLRPSTPSDKADSETDSTKSQTPVSQSPEYLQQLIKKQFFPNSSCNNFQDVLPALTSSTDVDTELYALIGLLFRSFIHKWYKNITDDTEFTNELVKVVAHITRQLETRLKAIDVIDLLFDDIPFVLDEHLSSYRRVLKELGSSYLPFETIDSGFDHISSHIALTRSPESKDLYLKMLANNILQKLLPPDEFKSELVKKFVGALIGDMLFKIITSKLSQPYQIFEIIQLLCKAIVGDAEKTPNKGAPTPDTNPPIETPNNLFTSAISSISHFIADTTSSKSSCGSRSHKKVGSLHVFSFINNLFCISKHRPTVYSAIKTFSLLAKHDKLDHIFYNILLNRVVKPLCSVSIFKSAIKAARTNLFPTDEDMGPPRIEPDLEEFEKIRQTTKDYLLKVCKKFQVVSYLFLATNDEELDAVIDDFLTSFEHQRLNEHLVFRLVDLLVLRLIPEMSES